MPSTGTARKSASSGPSSPATETKNHKKTPVTIMIPEILDKNLAVHCAISRKSKSQFITDALEQTLRENHGLDPYAEPKISY